MRFSSKFNYALFSILMVSFLYNYIFLMKNKKWKTKFLHMLVKLVLISDTYCIFIVCYTPIATFQKADTCLDAQQSMAKQPIKG